MDQERPWALSIFWLGASLGLFSLLAGSLVFSVHGSSLGVQSSLLVTSSIVLCAVGAWKGKVGRIRESPPCWYAVAIGAVVLVVSDFLWRRTNCYQLESFALSLAAVAPVAIALVRWPRLLTLVALVMSIYALVQFLSLSAGRMLFSDDHPSFIYRLIQLRHSFPVIPIYNPYWNAGVEAREFFPSGVLSFFFLWLPLWYSLDVSTTYTTLFALTIFAVLPLSVWGASRWSGVSPRGCVCAACLSLLTSLLWYRWALKYGTVGFVTMCIFYPLALSSGLRVAVGSAGDTRRYAVLALLAVSMTLFWPLGGLALAPLLLVFIWQLPQVLRRCAGILFVCGALAIHLPWMWLFAEASNVFQLIIAGAHPGGELALKKVTSVHTDGFSWSHALKQLRVDAASIHPLIILFCLPGLWSMKEKLMRRMYGVSALWLLLLGAGMSTLHPTLELDRFLTLLGILLCIPCGAGMAEVLDWASTGWEKLSPAQNGPPAACARSATPFWGCACSRLQGLSRVMVASGLLSLLLMNPFALRRIITGKSVEQYTFADNNVSAISNAISYYGGPGRTMFAGFILHELSGGHVAPLAAWTGHPLLASRYQHDRWTYVDVIPEEFRKGGRKSVYEFLDLHNISAVVTHDRFWRKWVEADRNSFRRVWSGPPFHLYQRQNFSSSYFLSGDGSIVSQEPDRVKLVLETPQAILKFNFVPHLQVVGCRVAPAQVSPSLRFISLSDCPVGEEISIQMAPPIDRLLSSVVRSRVDYE